MTRYITVVLCKRLVFKTKSNILNFLSEDLNPGVRAFSSHMATRDNSV